MSDYWSKKWNALKEEEEKKKKQETPSGYWEQKSAELKAQTTATANDDIAPVKTTTTEKDDNKKWYDGLLRKTDALNDGFQITDIPKMILGTNADIATNAVAGVVGWGEKLVDAVAPFAGLTAEKLGLERGAEKVKEIAASDLYDEKEVTRKLLTKPYGQLAPFATALGAIFTFDDWLNSKKVDDGAGGTITVKEDNSILGDTSDSIVQSAGELVAKKGLQAAAGGAPIGDIITGVTAFGGQAEQALREDATFMQAIGSGGISAAAEIIFEKLSGGIKIGGKALDDGLTRLISKNIASIALRNGVHLTKDIAGEALEEVLTEGASKLGTMLYKEGDLTEILFNKDALNDYARAAFSGALLGGGFNLPGAISGSHGGYDYKATHTDNEQKVIDKEIENRIAEQEADGKKLTGKEKTAIEESVKRDLEKGYISIDTIESAIGGETYDNYKSLTEHETEIKKEIETLENLPDNQISVKQREQLKALRDELKALEDDSTVSQYKDRLSQEVSELAKNDRLVESYNEKARRGQAFEADLSKYSEKQRATVQRAIDSGVLNNTNRSHELVDLVAKLEEDKALPFDFTNNEKLKETGFALEGKTVNGYVTKDGVTLNVNSKKALNSVVGHEITHVLEGTELYSELQQVVKNYAVTKGEYETRYEALTKLYEGVEGANIESEITADLIGDYLFTDSEFVNRLSTEQPNIFKKVYEEIKYLYKIATAGSKEARELERVKRAFEEAYRADGKGVSGTKFSLNEYSEHQKKNWENSKRIVVYDSNEQLSQFIQDSIADKTMDKKMYFGAISSDLASRIQTDTGLDVENYNLSLGSYEVRKILKDHGNESTEAPRGQRAIVEDDFAHIVDVVLNPTSIELSQKQYMGKPAIIFQGEHNGKMNVIAVVSDKRLDLFVQTIYANAKKENLSTPIGEQAPINTPEANGGTVSSADSVANPEKNVKPQYSLSSDSKGRDLSPAIQKRFGNSKVVDENGSLKVVYHGTASGEFSIFDKAKGNVEGDFGSGFYFTDSEYDVSEHYEDGGPDFEIKVGRRADEIYNEESDIEYEEAKRRAREELYKGGHKFEVYLNIEKPAIVGETILLDSESYYSEYNQEDYDSEEDYEGEVEQLIADDIDGIIWDVENNVDVYSTDGLADVLWNAVSEGGIGLEELKSRINDLYLENSNGELVGNEVARQVIESLGYDGIIDPTVSTKWNMEMEDGTTHYIVFKPNQIKAVTNQNPTDNPDIHRSLSANGEAPLRYGNFNIFGEDVALEKPQTDMQDEAEEIAPSTTEKSSEVGATRSEMEQVETAEEAPAENIAPQTQKKRKPSKAALVRLTKKQTYSGGRNLQGAYNVDGKQYISDGVFVAEFNAIDERLEHNAEMPIEAFQNFLNNAVNGQSAEKYSIDFDKITEINKGKKDGAFISVGGVPFNSKYVEAVLRAIENPVFALSKHRGGINVLVAVGDNGKVMLMPVRAGEKLTAAYEAQEITAAPESITPTTAEDATAARVEGMANINDADAPQEVEAPYYETENSATPEDPFTDRDYKAVGNRKVKAYMYENPEVRPFFQEAAQAMLGDLQNSTKGERVYNDEAYYESGGEKGWSGVERHTTDDIAYLLDKGYTYAEIEKGLNAIIEDNGAENIAIAKRIEFAINDRLRQGYTDIYGNQIPRNQEYLNMLSQKQAAETASAQAPMYSDADAPLPTDADAPVEDIAPSAPVAEKYEAIRPARQKQTEPRMTRVDTAEPRMARADKPPKDPRGELRSWAETSTESEALDGQIPIEELDQELIHYQPISNRKTLETANARLGNLGYEKSLTYFEGKFAGSDTKVEDIVLGERLVQEAVKRGDKATAMKLIQDIAILGTELGQKVQALSIIQRLTPEGQLMMLQRVVERGKAKGDKAFEGVEVTEEQAGRILDTLNPDGTFDQAELNAAVEDVKQEIADQMKVTAGEKINAYRYLAMLGNAKTHIRNLVSNIAMKGTAAVKNALARTAEDLLLPEAVLSNRRYGEKSRAAKSVIPNGTKVRAADRDNIGTVKSYDAATGKYTVYFENEAGHSATVKLGADVVKPLNPIKSTAADSTADDIAPTRTKTWRRATEEVKAYAKQVTAEMESVLSGENKYSASGDIKAKRRIFKNSAMNSLYEINNKLLTKEDTIFKNPAFESSFREFLTANGIRTDEDIKYNPEIVEKGKQYATEQALIATFQQESWLANKIGEIENKNAAFGVAVGAIMPFKKTPINIAKTGLNYSPLGFAKSLFYDAAQVRKGEMDKSTLIDHLAQNVTGSALAVAGYLLAKSGILTGAGDDDKEGDYDYQLGKQGYSLKIGDQTYSLSWLTPVSMPLFVGANAYEQLVEDKGWSGDVVMETLAQTLDPLSEMSFLSGLDNVLSSYDSGIQKFMGIGESMAQNYATQFVPTALSQVAAITDDKKRTTKVGADSGFRFLDQAVNQIKYKIPGLRQTLEPATDIWGNEVEQSDNLITRAFENAIAPYARKENISTEIDEEIKGLYRETGEDGLIPSIPKNYLNYNNEKYEMSAGEYTAYKKTYGQTASSMLEALFNTSTYRNATVEERADMVDDVYEYARDEANKEFLSGNGIDYTNAEKEGKEYYRENFIKGAIENDVTVEEYGFSYNYPEKYKFLKDIGVSYDEYSASDESKDAYSWAFNNPEKYTLSKAVASDVITYRKYAGELYDIKADKDSSGKSITGSRKEKVIDYINNLDADYGERIILFKSEYNADDTYNYDIIDYLNSREDISYEEMATILKELGFTVSSDGTITWD